jgi:hypothetical protein
VKVEKSVDDLKTCNENWKWFFVWNFINKIVNWLLLYFLWRKVPGVSTQIKLAKINPVL